MSSTPTAAEPTRYTPVHEDAMVCESDGTYVRYDDYVKLRALAQELVDGLYAAERYMTSVSPRVGPGCSCKCSVIDGHTKECAVINAITSAASQGFTPTNKTEG